MTLHEKPPNATQWSVRSMAAAAGISHSSVQRIWHAHGLKPHLVETFKISRDRNFAAKVADGVGLYLNPPDTKSRGAPCCAVGVADHAVCCRWGSIFCIVDGLSNDLADSSQPIAVEGSGYRQRQRPPGPADSPEIVANNVLRAPI